jgi:hypothetical protein
MAFIIQKSACYDFLASWTNSFIDKEIIIYLEIVVFLWTAWGESEYKHFL